MKIEHIAVWTSQLEDMCKFYTEYFGAKSSNKYTNATTGFESYFLTFTQGARLEIMQSPVTVKVRVEEGQKALGFAHIAFETGSREAVIEKTNQLRTAGYTIASEPRTTGDGYFESVVLDPEGNAVEITV